MGWQWKLEGIMIDASIYIYTTNGNMMGWFSGLVIGDVYYELITNPENQRKTLRKLKRNNRDFEQ
jgi:hypothetical protein